MRAIASRMLGFPAAQSGVAAVEFALILPVMVIMLLGLSEVTLGVNTSRKITLVSRSLADLTSRAQTLSTTDLDDVFKAAGIVMQPFSSAALRMTVTQIRVTKVGETYLGTTDWSCARGPGAQAKTILDTFTVPTGFRIDGSYYMLIEAKLPYQPIFGGTFIRGRVLEETTPWPIRNNSKVSQTGGCPANT